MSTVSTEFTVQQCLSLVGAALRDVLAGEVLAHEGICAAVERRFEEFRIARGEERHDHEEDCVEEAWESNKRAMFEKWGEYSGDIVFPVCVDNRQSGSSAYFYAVDNDSMWDGDYGKARFRLLKYLITEFDELTALEKSNDE